MSIRSFKYTPLIFICLVLLFVLADAVNNNINLSRKPLLKKLDNNYQAYGEKMTELADWLDTQITTDTSYELSYNRGLELGGRYIEDDDGRVGFLTITKQPNKAGSTLFDANVHWIQKFKGKPYFTFIVGDTYRDDCDIFFIIPQKHVTFNPKWFPDYKAFNKEQFLNESPTSFFEKKSDRFIVLYKRIQKEEDEYR